MSIPHIVLAPNLDLIAATALKNEIASHAGNSLVIDASAVERLGGQCLQILLAAHAKWRAEEASLRLINPSDAFSADLHLLGAGRLLGEWVMEEVCS